MTRLGTVLLCIAVGIALTAIDCWMAGVIRVDRTQARLWRCVLADSELRSGLPRACTIPATCEQNARKRAAEVCRWQGKTFYVLPVTSNYPDVIQMELTP